MISIMLIDDHPSVGEGTKNRLEQEGDLQVTVVSSGMEALELLANGAAFDLMLCDLNMPVINGLELTKRILDINSDALIVIYTGFEIAPNFNMLMEAGVSGFISKATSWEQMVQSIRCALRGESVIPTMLLKQLRRMDLKLAAPDTNKSMEHTSINQKEQTILQEVALGKSNKDIASLLFMSQRTVEYHLSRIFEKLNVRSRSEAVVEAKKHGLIQNVDFL
ncbi:response regulator transcription factor [Paenibacillus sp. SI8]|uniref:response regulator transcription factor n=1 Tax=unclassified Paenibacillus TaxID=185978 RepID=UPI0034664BAE